MSQEITPKTLTPYMPQNGMKVIRNILPDQTREYNHPHGNEVNVVPQELGTTLIIILEKLQIAVDMLKDDDYSRFGTVFDSLLFEANVRIQQVSHCIEEQIGEIDLYVIAHSQYPYKTGDILDATLTCNEDDPILTGNN